MYKRLRCTNEECGRRARVPDSVDSSRVTCPECGSPMAEVLGSPPARGRHGGERPSSPLGPRGAASESPAPDAGSASSSAIVPVWDRADRAGSVDRTEVNFVLTALLGLVLHALVCGPLLLLAPETYMGRLFTYSARGWVPHAVLFLAAWSVAILLLKHLKLRTQRGFLSLEVLPRSIGAEIRLSNVDRFRSHLRELPRESRGGFLVARVARALEHFKSRRSVQEVASLLSSQSDLDSSAVESSYTMLRVFIWAVPILGFIGTVIGIGDAVSGFSDGLEQAQNIAAIKDSLKGVTTGLGTAFDTTLIALVTSILLMFPTHWLQKSEEDTLDSVSDFCNQELLMRLEEESEAPLDPTTAAREILEPVLEEHRRELGEWRESLGDLGGTMARQVLEGWREVQGELRDAWARQAEGAREVIASASAAHREEFDQWSDGLRRLGAELAAEMSKDLGRAGRELRGESQRDLASVRALLADAAREREKAAAEGPALRDEVLRRIGEASEALGESAERAARAAGETAASAGELVARATREASEAVSSFGGSVTRATREAAEQQARAVEASREIARVVHERSIQLTEALRDGAAEGARRAEASARSFLEGLERLEERLKATTGERVAAVESMLGELSGLAEGVRERLPAAVASSVEALEKLLRGQEGVVEAQKVLAANLDVLARSRSFRDLLVSLRDRVGELGPVIETLAVGAEEQNRRLREQGVSNGRGWWPFGRRGDASWGREEA